MGCGCRKVSPTGSNDTTTSPSAAPQPQRRPQPQYGTSLLTSVRHLGPASMPATDQAGVTFGKDNLLGTIQALRRAVLPSKVLDFERPLPTKKTGALPQFGAVIVQNASATTRIGPASYLGQMPLGQQPLLDKPYPWKT